MRLATSLRNGELYLCGWCNDACVHLCLYTPVWLKALNAGQPCWMSYKALDGLITYLLLSGALQSIEV